MQPAIELKSNQVITIQLVVVRCRRFDDFDLWNFLSFQTTFSLNGQIKRKSLAVALKIFLRNDKLTKWISEKTQKTHVQSFIEFTFLIRVDTCATVNHIQP